MVGPRQRQSVGTMMASAEAGGSRHSAPAIVDKTRQSASTVAKRQNSSKSVSLARTKVRRFIFRLQKNPQHLALFLTCMIVVAVLLGVTTVSIIRCLHSKGVSSPNHIIMDHNEKARTAAFLNTATTTNAQRAPDRNRRKSVRADKEPMMEILLASIHPSVGTFQFPNNAHFNEELGMGIDHGGLYIQIFEEEDAKRYIVRDFQQEETNYRHPEVAQDDDMDPYYFFDDDYFRGLVNTMDKNGLVNEKKRCRKIAEHELNLPNCNEFHQIDRSDPSHQIKYLNEGAYRQVFSAIHSYGNQTEVIAIKDLSIDHDLSYEEYEFIRMDAIVAERLSASPRIYDIYGFCGIGILSEYFHFGDIEGDVTGGDEGYAKPGTLKDEEEVKPQNNLTGIEKLVLALEMAESLADLHGYPNGAISHDDLNLSQYLLNKDKTRLKLNDFNRAEFLLYDEENGEYCQWTNGHGYGDWRAPEEFQDHPLTEQIDVWSLANNMYTLLTGLYPFYDVDWDQEKLIKKLLGGETPYIDPRYNDRSPSEGVLTELIPKCFALDPEDRPTIFEVVHFLREGVKKNLSEGMTREKVLQGITTSR